ncbi:YcxB family protein [Pontibacterium sp.]|uniref:YcxB family protein n=1 Tax=Pontibacterium sp. TaxID=2036026 RepID=UPI003568DAE7
MTDTAPQDSNTSTDQSSHYILNREYFTECFDQSVDTTVSLKKYRLAILLIIMSAVLFTVEAEPHIAWFLLALGAVELLSIRYKRSWWVARQMLSRRANSRVNVRIDEQGIYTDSKHHQQSILWDDIAELKTTEKGFIVIHKGGTNYLSRTGLDKDFLARLNDKSNAIT